MSDVTILALLRDVSVGAAITAALILLARLVFGKLLTARAKYYLWLLLALRLLLPVTPGSPVSLMNYVPMGGVVQESAPALEATAPAETAHPNLADAETEPETQMQPAREGAVMHPPDSKAAPVKPDWPQLALWIWLIGMIAVLTGYLVLYIMAERKLMALPVCGDADTQREFLHLRQSLHVSDRIRLVSGEAGMLGGLRHPTLVIPVERRGEDVAPILVHELMHYKYGDLWLYLLMRVLTAVYWFHPIVWICFWWARQDSEKACDERVLASGLVSAYDYAELLYQEGRLHRGLSPLPRTTFGGGHSLKRRMKEIARYRKRGRWVMVVAGILAVLITACGVTSVAEREPALAAPAGELVTTAEKPEASPRQDPEAVIAGLQPEFGRFGWTWEQHVEAGLLDPEIMEINQLSPIATEYLTTVSFRGEELEASFIFSCTLFTETTTGRQVLTEIYLDLPRGTEDELRWLDEVMAERADRYDRDPLGRYVSHDTVGPLLGDQQFDYAARRLLEDEYAAGLRAAEESLGAWYLESVGYAAGYGRWTINGTGLALYETRGDMAPAEAPAVFDPYVPEDGVITFRETAWGMGVEDVFSVEHLDREAWRYVPDGNVIQPGPDTAPAPDHPEVTDIAYCFNFIGPDLSYGLDLVIVRYDPEQVSYGDLVRARTRVLGEPGYSGEDKTLWETAKGYTLMLLPHEKELTERLVYKDTAFVSNAGAFLDVEAYLADLQPPGGHFGWTYGQHVEAGLLKDGLRQEPTEDGYRITGAATLGGYDVEIDYLFGPTLASEEPVLRQAFVRVPGDVQVRQWVEAFWDPWKNKLMENGSLRFVSPVTLNLLLPEETQKEIIDTINRQQDRQDASLSNWSLLWQGYMPEDGLWQYNGTGAALWETLQE